jgi:hypothetical protein
MVIPMLLAAVGADVAAMPAGETKEASVETNQVDAVPQLPDEAER